MPEISKDSLREQLKKRQILPVYLLYGVETYLRDLAAKTIADRTFDEGDLRDFNISEFDLNDNDDLQPALAAAEQLPMMAQRRLVRITGVRIAATSNRDTLKEANEDRLLAYLKDPSPQSVVVFIADEINKNRKLGKSLVAGAAAVEFKPLVGAELYTWIKSEAANRDSKIDDATARYLASFAGPDLRRLSIEIKKLSAAALPGKEVTIDLIDALVAHSSELSNFELTDHLVTGRRKEAFRAMRKILDDGAEPLALLGLISYNFRRLLIAKEMMAAGADKFEIARAAKLRPGEHESFLASARRIETNRLRTALRRLAEVDLAIKTSVGGGGLVGCRMQIEMLVSEMARPDGI
jgi:DNA polymerase III subunit delta